MWSRIQIFILKQREHRCKDSKRRETSLQRFSLSTFLAILKKLSPKADRSSKRSICWRTLISTTRKYFSANCSMMISNKFWITSNSISRKYWAKHSISRSSQIRPVRKILAKKGSILPTEVILWAFCGKNKQQCPLLPQTQENKTVQCGTLGRKKTK